MPLQAFQAVAVAFIQRPHAKPPPLRVSARDAVADLFKSKNWIETESDVDWDVAWVDKDWIRENFMQHSLAEHQRINHFPNHYELTRKDNLIKNLKRTQRALQREGLVEEAARYDFFPGTYVLPADYGLFVEEFKNHPAGTIWIMKPTGSAQGKGIFLFHKLQQINEWKKDSGWKSDSAQAAAYVVQVAAPYNDEDSWLVCQLPMLLHPPRSLLAPAADLPV